MQIVQKSSSGDGMQKMKTEKRATETWGYQILPTLYSNYQKVLNLPAAAVIIGQHSLSHTLKPIDINTHTKTKTHTKYLITFFLHPISIYAEKNSVENHFCSFYV